MFVQATAEDAIATAKESLDMYASVCEVIVVYQVSCNILIIECLLTGYAGHTHCKGGEVAVREIRRGCQYVHN